MVKGFPRIEIAGKMPTFPIIPTGAFKTEIIAKSWKNYEIRHTFNGMQMLNLKIAIINGKMEMIGKYGMTHKTHLVMEYEYMRCITNQLMKQNCLREETSKLSPSTITCQSWKLEDTLDSLWILQYMKFLSWTSISI